MVVDVNFWQRAENNFCKTVWNDSWCFQGKGHSRCCQQNNGIHHHDLLDFVEVSMQVVPFGSSFNLQQASCMHLAAALSSNSKTSCAVSATVTVLIEMFTKTDLIWNYYINNFKINQKVSYYDHKKNNFTENSTKLYVCFFILRKENWKFDNKYFLSSPLPYREQHSTAGNR